MLRNIQNIIETFCVCLSNIQNIVEIFCLCLRNKKYSKHSFNSALNICNVLVSVPEKYS